MDRRYFSKAVGLTALATATRGMAADDAETAALSAHRIEKIEFGSVDQSWPRFVGKNARLDDHGQDRRSGIVKVHTDQGAMGWSLSYANDETKERMRRDAVGRTVAELFRPDTGVRGYRWEPIDIALHDLAGIILEKPAWKMLGGGAEPELRKVYSGMIYFDDLREDTAAKGIDKVLANCQWDYDYGYRQFKVKIGRGNRWMDKAEGLRRDVEVVRAIAEAFPDVDILVDGNDGFTVDGAILFLRAIGDTRLFWFEEPFRETREDWTELHDWMKANDHGECLLADGEANPDIELVDKLSADGILDVQLMDLYGYGLTRWRERMPKIAGRGVLASPHTWGSALKTVYTTHLVGALGNAPTIEGVTCSDEDVDYGDNRIVDGNMVPSNEPGFGMRLK